MKLEKIINAVVISISQEEANQLIAKGESGEKFTCEEKNVFLVKYSKGSLDNNYVVLDNRDEACMIAHYQSLSDALARICDLKVIALELGVQLLRE